MTSNKPDESKPMPEQITMRQFISRNGIHMTCKRVDSNPNMEDSGSPMNHWRCTLRFRGRQMTLVYSMGMAFDREPQPWNVLHCLAADAAGLDSAGGCFEEWAADYGYDPDSRKAERIFRAVTRQTAKLRKLLGEETYETLLQRVDWE